MFVNITTVVMYHPQTLTQTFLAFNMENYQHLKLRREEGMAI